MQSFELCFLKFLLDVVLGFESSNFELTLVIFFSLGNVPSLILIVLISLNLLSNCFESSWLTLPIQLSKLDIIEFSVIVCWVFELREVLASVTLYFIRVDILYVKLINKIVTYSLKSLSPEFFVKIEALIEFINIIKVKIINYAYNIILALIFIK